MFSAFLVIFGILFIAYSYSYSADGDLTGRSGRIYRVFTVFLGAAMVIVLFRGGVSGFTTRLWDYGIIPPVLFPLFFAFPAFLTCINVVTLIQNRTEKTAVTDLMTISIGGIMWYILVGISMEIYEKPWYEPVHPNGYHEFLSSDYQSNIVLLTVLGLVSKIGRAHVWNSSHTVISYAVFSSPPTVTVTAPFSLLYLTALSQTL